MATPHQKLADSLAILRDLQKHGHVFRWNELSRVHRARLVRNGFLREVIKGWLISNGPEARDGDSTAASRPWYASFLEFCARYCDERFGDEWHLSPEQSVLLHAEQTVIPPQVIIHSPKATNHKLPLPFGTSIFDLRQHMPAADDLTIRDGLRVFTPAAAVIRVSEPFFQDYPIETQVVLGSIPDASDVLRRLLEGGHSVVAGRLAGAFRRIGRAEIADEIGATMRAADYVVRETDPFAGESVIAVVSETPLAGRMRAMWQGMRGRVLRVFPPPAGLPKKKTAFLRRVDAIYQADAYHSLSIEGYLVSDALIEPVRSGNWNPDRHDGDRQSRDALAARGYWQAFQAVKTNVSEIIGGSNAGKLVRTAHRAWYRELFQPCVSAGLIPATALAGYRNAAVYLRTSRYVPPRPEAVRDAMTTLFDLLEKEPEPAVRAVLGHWMLGYVHPYPDGNGRMARFLMNAMLASGGYPWTIIRVEDRDVYLSALDRASIDGDISPFADFIAKCVRAAE
jgi:fido (protein-threonine AMPylation protein)